MKKTKSIAFFFLAVFLGAPLLVNIGNYPNGLSPQGVLVLVLSLLCLGWGIKRFLEDRKNK